jgi:hypothetical protein
MSKVAIIRGHESLVYIVAFIGSILLSVGIGYRESIINPDGICYLLSAQLIGTIPLKEVMHFCPQAQWPLYSMLIYGFAQISHLTFPVAASVLNSGFSLLSVLAFILIIKELGGTRQVLWLAALVILCDYQFNVLRDNIIRDHGFWGFYLSSIYFALKYFRDPKWITALAWNASLLIATLFRIEGAIFLLAVPFLSWFCWEYNLKERATAFFRLNFLTLVICLPIAAWLLSHPQGTINKLGRVSEIVNQIQHGLFMLMDRYYTTKQALIHHVLPPDSTSDAGVILFAVWLTWYVFNVVVTLSLSYAVLLVYAWKSHVPSFSLRSSRIIWGYLAINFIITLAFLAEHLFVSKRYLVALTLVLMLWVPFALNDLIQKWSSLRHRILLCIMIVMISIATLSGIVRFGYSKSYIRSAGNWIAANVPANAKLYTNDLQLMYYTQHFGTDIYKILPDYLKINTINHGQWEQYDFLALRLGNHKYRAQTALLREMRGLTPVQVFSNSRGNRVAIYKITRGEVI